MESKGGTRIGATLWFVGKRAKQQRMATALVLDGRTQDMKRICGKVGDRVQALKTLTSVLPQAATEGYVRAFLEVGASLTPLLTILCNRRQAPTVATLLRRLLDALALPAHNGAPATAMAHHHTHLDAPLEPLSERELEVLRAVAAGLSDRQVAEQLYLAVGTVKKHLNNLYGKLGVNSRTAALAQARAFHLL